MTVLQAWQAPFLLHVRGRRAGLYPVPTLPFRDNTSFTFTPTPTKSGATTIRPSELSRPHLSSARHSKTFSPGRQRPVRREPTIWPGSRSCSHCVAGLLTPSSRPVPATSPYGSAFLRFRQVEQQIGSTFGSMGFGLPAAIGAARVFPKRIVVCFAGDGHFLMHGQEFATAVHYRLAIVVVLIDNGMYGTIRMHQEREFPGRVIASNLRNPGSAAYACFRRSGRNYRRNIAVSSSFRKGPRLRIPSIIHVKIDPEAITPTTILKAIRSAALSR